MEEESSEEDSRVEEERAATDDLHGRQAPQLEQTPGDKGQVYEKEPSRLKEKRV